MAKPVLMNGFPPEPVSQVTLENWRTPPFNRWAFHHVNEILPCAIIWRGDGPATHLPRASRNVMETTFRDHRDEQVTVRDYLDRNHVDGFCILHRGSIVSEHYRNGFQAHNQHLLASVSKSLTALITGVLVERGLLDPDEGVTHLIPELEESAFGDCKLQHILDMTVASDFVEDYTATEGPIVEYREVTGWKPLQDPAHMGDLRSWLPSMCKEGEHGAMFHYVSPCTDLLGWIVERATGRRFVDVASEYLWQPLGAEQNALITVDRLGAPRTAGGICVSLRDLARVGQMMLDNGQINGRQVIPETWVADTRFGADRDAWKAGEYAAENPDGGYRNKWWIIGDSHTCYTGIGIHGQYLWIDPVADMVIAKLASEPLATDDSISLDTARCFQAIGAALAE